MTEEYNSDDKGQTIPLYETVKFEIYVNFQSLKDYNAKVRNPLNSSEQYASLKHYKRAFNQFYDEINHESKLKGLSDNEKKILKFFNRYPERIMPIHIGTITTICRKIIENIGITNIGSKTKDNWGI